MNRAQRIIFFGPSAPLIPGAMQSYGIQIMSKPACPLYERTDVLDYPDRWDGVACGTVLADGDPVALIKDLKLEVASQILKEGTQVKGIHLAAGDHEISCKIDGSAIGPKRVS